MKTIHVTKKFMGNVQYDHLNNLDLRSDLENNNIFATKLVGQGYVGNRPSNFEGSFHEDDTWAIDCHINDGSEVENYLYISEHEYNEDIEILTL